MLELTKQEAAPAKAANKQPIKQPKETKPRNLEVEVGPVDPEDFDEQIEARQDAQALEQVLFEPELEGGKYKSAAPPARPESPRRGPPVPAAAVVEKGDDVRVHLAHHGEVAVKSSLMACTGTSLSKDPSRIRMLSSGMSNSSISSDSPLLSPPSPPFP